MKKKILSEILIRYLEFLAIKEHVGKFLRSRLRIYWTVLYPPTSDDDPRLSADIEAYETMSRQEILAYDKWHGKLQFKLHQKEFTAEPYVFGKIKWKGFNDHAECCDC